MVKTAELLGREDYSNYRNVRAALVMFVFLGGLLALGGVVVATGSEADPKRDIPPAAAIGIAVVGLAGFVGGMAALLGGRRWAKLTYVMAVPYILGFPIGTIMSYTVLTGMSRYLDSKDRLKQAVGG